jgi:hypothetical protein
MPAIIGVVISEKMATLIELQTIYSYEDMEQMYEVICVNNYNEWRMQEEARKK